MLLIIFSIKEVFWFFFGLRLLWGLWLFWLFWWLLLSLSLSWPLLFGFLFFVCLYKIWRIGASKILFILLSLLFLLLLLLLDCSFPYLLSSLGHLLLAHNLLLNWELCRVTHKAIVSVVDDWTYHAQDYEHNKNLLQQPSTLHKARCLLVDFDLLLLLLGDVVNSVCFSDFANPLVDLQHHWICSAKLIQSLIKR